jgi:tetratricopeptide (TPR) repeat protein
LKIQDIDRRIADLVAMSPRAQQPKALVSLGRELLTRDIEAATKCFDKAIAIDSRYVPAWIGRSDALCLLGRKGQAIGCLERAIDVEPKNAELAERKSKLLAELAVASSRNRRFEPPSSSNPVAVAKAPPSSKQRIVEVMPDPKPEPEPASESKIEAKPEPKPEPKSEPKVEQTPERTSAPELDVKPAPKSEPKPEPAPESDWKPASEPELAASPRSNDPLEQAWALLSAGKHIEALRKVEPLTKLPDVSADVWMIRGEICAALDQGDAEITSYEHATKCDPKNVPAWLALAKARVRMKRLERALDAADQALLLAPFDGDVQKLRGKILVALKQETAAVAAFEKATQHAPDDAEVWLELGRVLTTLKKTEAARQALQRALDIAETMQPKLVAAATAALAKVKSN